MVGKLSQMADKTTYDLIKRQNGERFAQTIRKLDSTIFDIPDIVEIVRYAGNDAEPILPYLQSLKKTTFIQKENPGDPFELLYSAGYDAVYADTRAKQDAIKPYFAKNEELCTFRDPDRYKNYYIVNVVHRDADKLQRKQFTKPEREDAYGTSVMSIQILKTGGFISIKNRYNHAVQSPDNTYYSNPDNIVPGLAAALSKYFNVTFDAQSAILPSGYTVIDNHLCKVNIEAGNTYYGADFVATDGKITPIDKRSQIVMDDSVFDLKSKGTIFNNKNYLDGGSSVASIFADQARDKKIHITKTPDGATRLSCDDDTYVDVIDGQIVAVSFPNLTHLPTAFMYNNRKCRKVLLPNAHGTAHNLLLNDPELEEIDISQVEALGNNSLYAAKKLKHLSVPNVKTVGFNVLRDARSLEKLEMPAVETIEEMFLMNGYAMRHLSLPNVREIGDHFMQHNKHLETLDIHNVRKIGQYVLSHNSKLTGLYTPFCDVDRTFCVSNRTARKSAIQSRRQYKRNQFKQAVNALLTRMTERAKYFDGRFDMK